MFRVNTHSTPVETSRVQFLPFLKKLGFWYFKKKNGSSSGSGSTKKSLGPVQVLFLLLKKLGSGFSLGSSNLG